MSKEIDAYIESAPDEQQEQLRKLRGMIEERLPGLETAFPNGFPVYMEDGAWISGFAWRKKGTMFYIMLGDILESRADQLGKLISGKSCLHVKPNKTINLDAIENHIAEMLDEAKNRLA